MKAMKIISLNNLFVYKIFISIKMQKLINNYKNRFMYINIFTYIHIFV